MSVSGPITLAIETSNPASTPGGGAVALVRGGGEGVERLGVENVGPASRHDDALVPAIDRLCRGVGVGAGALDRVAVSIGPGGYTSLRIAVTTAKVIAEVSGAELLGVPTASALMRRVDRGGLGEGRVAVCLAWKRKDVWVQRFGVGDGRAVGPGRVVGLESAVEAGDVLVVGEARLRRRLEEMGVLGAGPGWSEARFDPVAVFEASVGMEGVEPGGLVPLYPREPEAVSKWREREGG